MWRLDGLGTPYRTMYLSTWAFLSGACVTTAYVSFCRVRDRSEVEEEVVQGAIQGVDQTTLAEERAVVGGLDDEANLGAWQKR